MKEKIKREKNEIRNMVKDELNNLAKVVDVSDSLEKLKKSTWICPYCKDEYSNSITYCRKCALRVRKAKRKEYLKKYGDKQ